MSMIFQVDLAVLIQLIRLKFTNAYQMLFDKFINVSIWSVCTLFVSGYLMQSFGLSQSYGAFQFGGIIASIGIFELYSNAITFVSDLEGDRTIAYYLTLPTHTATVLCSHVLYYAIVGSLISFMSIVPAKLILWNKLNLLAINWIKLLLFVVLINLFCATLTLLISAFVPSMDKFDTLWLRTLFPLWFLGGFQFSWYSVHSALPMFSYLMLLNPFLYMSEGIRYALLGPDGTISFWLCCLILVIMLVGVAYWSYKRLKKRLDFV